MKIFNPATDELLQELNDDTAHEIKEKFSRAQRAQVQWAKLDYSKRKSIILKFGERLLQKKEPLSQILTIEMGKPITQARNEIQGVLPRVNYFVERVENVLKTENVYRDAASGFEEEISQEPLGVIGNISAWNYPFFVGANVFLPALLTGNAVLYKPSEFSTLTGLGIAETLYESGVPEDIFIPILGGSQPGAHLIDQPIQGLFFTGSLATGRKIASAFGSRFLRLQLELGGKDPVYICDDAEIQFAAENSADGAFYNTGQSCCSVERIYVHAQVYESYLEAFLKTVRAFKIGDPMKEDTYIGPLTRKAQIAILERQIEHAVKKGAKLLLGGNRIAGKGNFFEPTVLTEVDHSMNLMCEESFGPVIGIQKVNSDEEALSLMNETEYGLTAGVYSKNQSRARSLLSQVNAGSVYWNCCDRVSPRLPWSGRKHSGIGHTLSTYGIHAFLQPKAWHLKG